MPGTRPVRLQGKPESDHSVSVHTFIAIKNVMSLISDSEPSHLYTPFCHLHKSPEFRKFHGTDH